MKSPLAIFLVAMLGACSTGNNFDPTPLITDASGYRVTCDDPQGSTAECYEKASAKCKIEGHGVVEAKQMKDDADSRRTLIFGCR